MRLLPALILPALISITPVAAQAAPLATLSADLTGDAITDRAVLEETKGDGSADLFLYVGNGDGTQTQIAHAPGFVWSGGIGQQPELELAANGSLQV